jgi:hypothetical protein
VSGLKSEDGDRLYARKRDHHHLFFQGRFYKDGYARALREDPYCKILVPRYLHKRLHENISNVPSPPDEVCRRVWRSIVRARVDGEISDCDPPIDRLNFLIRKLKWRNLDATRALERQRDFFEFCEEYELEPNPEPA